MPCDTHAGLQAGIEEFVRSCREPVLLEPGEEALVLAAGSYVVSSSATGVRIEAWDRSRNLTRRVVAISRQSAGRLELEVERFGKRTGVVQLIDRARASNQSLESRAARGVFAESFRLMLRRQYPQWRIAELTTSADLEHSLSPAFPRALLKRGSAAWAAIAAPAGASADPLLGSGLVWLEHLRRRETRTLIEGLALFVPDGQELSTCLRLRCLNPRAVRLSVFLHAGDNWESQIDPVVHGNLDTHLDPASMHAASHVTPFTPEALLEAAVRRQIEKLDAQLAPQPVYGQVPAFAGIDRGVLDLLAIEHSGRLTVVELKATADLQLPLQALDYWLRVRWHNERGDFTRLGYFPGLAISADLPRLLLAAPAFEFHSTTEALLRYLAADIPVERVGLGVEWQKEIAVMFRLRGAQAPR